MRSLQYRKQFFAILVVLFWMFALAAQELKSLPGQVSFVYPLGTSGIHSPEYKYSFSLNVLTGNTGGIDGFEAAGILNNTQQNVDGFQAAGIANFVQGTIYGAQFAGVINTSSSAKGCQAAGVVNINKGNVEGIQMAGTINLTSGKIKGAQFAGILNTSKSFKGCQAAGKVNIADSLKGVQIAGLLNMSKQVHGAQLAGTINIAREEIRGAQIACVNTCGRLNGVQIGVVNIADTAESGVAIGLVNIYRKGMYQEFEFSLSDHSNMAVSYKLGLRKFYSIYSMGVNIIEDKMWSFGVGLGNISTINENWLFQPEVIFQSYLPADFTEVSWASSSRVKLGFVYQLNENIGISIAPEFSVSEHEVGGKYKLSPIKPLWSSSSKRTELGLGLSLGISFRK